MKGTFFDSVMTVWERVFSLRQLVIIRNGLTLTLPFVVAGALALLLNNLPIVQYQDFMERMLGEYWKDLGIQIYNATIAVMSLIITLTIGQSVAEDHNQLHPLDVVHTNIVALVAFCSLMAMVQPVEAMLGGAFLSAVPYRWLGAHGIFLNILIAFAASYTFMKLFSFKKLRLTFFSEDADNAIPHAFNALLPGLLTVFLFAGIKVLSKTFFEVEDLHQLVYDLIYIPFKRMHNPLYTALLYTFLRHALWFFGVPGSTALEPIMTELYGRALEQNMETVASGLPATNIFTAPFFESFVSLGGSGATICLIVACLLYGRRGSIRKISQISILPAVFNINETILFGLPIVLNPFFLIPFICIPILLTLTTYVAMLGGWVPVVIHEVSWTTPIFISGYQATGSFSGAILQAVNIMIGVSLYVPFVKAAEDYKQRQFRANYNRLLDATTNDAGGGTETMRFITRTDVVGAMSRSFANDLLKAIPRDELFLEYQPQVDVRTGRVFGVEALIRWNHPEIGRIPPSLFIALAEDTNYITTIGLWVCHEAVRQLAEWRAAGLTDVVMSINASVKQLEDPYLPERVSQILKKYNVPPEFLEIEVTESVGLSSNLGHNVILQDIRSSGVLIAIDDFGMGHSSLVYLKQFPVDTLKLDRVLVQDIANNNSSAEIVSTISELCKSLNVHLLAEYVETKEQAKVLSQLKCYRYQGYLYSPSLSGKACQQVIRDGFPPLTF